MTTACPINPQIYANIEVLVSLVQKIIKVQRDDIYRAHLKKRLSPIYG